MIETAIVKFEHPFLYHTSTSPPSSLSLSDLPMITSSILSASFDFLEPKMHILTPSSLHLLVNLSLLSLFLLAKRSLGIDTRFLNCSVRKACGGVDIDFPFYIENQQPAYCGFPGFMVSCEKNRTLIKLSASDYLIQNISYLNHSLRVSNAATVNNSTASCLPSLQNLTLPPNQLNFSPNVAHLYLFYNCNTSRLSQILLPYKINCSFQQNEQEANLAIYNSTGFDQTIISDASNVCRPVVYAPVELEGDYHNNGSNGIMKILGNGFQLTWAAANCSLCFNSGGRCGFDYDIYQFKCYCPDRPHALRCFKGDGKRNLKIGLGVGFGCFVIFAICISSIYWFWYRPKRHSTKVLSKSISSEPSSSTDPEGSNLYFGVPVFSKSELEEATNSFDVSRELGDGGFGTVYYGKLQDGREVAVKRLYEHNYRRVKQFMTEVQILTRLHHKNLVHLYGCTSRHSRELLLVYEYIPNGTVADHIHGDRATQGLLTWAVRMSIAIETASALQYLHSSSIIHRDVKTHNILLDNNFCVKVADFGLSRLFPNDVTHVSTAPQGSPGYVDPEYHQSYQLTEKSDVYSFGVVLTELISSKPAVDITRDKHEINLSNFAISKIKKGAFSELIDTALGFNLDPEVNRMTTSVAELAFRCLQQDKEMRPTMEDVLEELEAIARTDDAKSRNPLPSPECEDVGLVDNMKFSFSPESVTQR